jgi:uncharacterized protein
MTGHPSPLTSHPGVESRGGNRSGSQRGARTRLRGPWTAASAAAAAVAMLITGCASSAKTSAQQPSATRTDAAPPAWFSYQRPATSGFVTSNVTVPAHDGTPLSCTLFRPAANSTPLPGRFPVVISNFWPYYTGGQYLDPRQNPNAQFFAQRGYADLVCATRGTYTSGGTFPGWFTPTDGTDNYDVIEWAAAQPWSTGRVGEEGASYGGINTLRAASARPPHLVAIAPQFAFNNAYLDYFYPGGIPNDMSQSPAPGVQDYRGVSPAQQNATWAAHPLDDSFWQHASVQTDRVTVPTLMIGGWPDYMVLGDIANYQTLARRNAWLVMGPWEHAVEPPATIEPMLLAWFDHWLKQLPAAPLPSARVTSDEMPEQGGDRWTEMSAYPPPDTHSERLILNSDRILSNAAGPAGSQAYTVNPHDGPPAICFPPGQGPCDPARDIATDDARRLTFTSAPLTNDLVVTGSIDIHLRAALSATDGDLIVKVMDVAPDGSVHQASVGYLKASHRLSQATPAALVPNQLTNFDITIWPTDWRFQTGHSLRLSITSGDYPKVAADAPGGTVTVATGQGGSYADLPVQGNG